MVVLGPTALPGMGCSGVLAPVVLAERGGIRPETVERRRVGRRASGGIPPLRWSSWICLSSLRICRSSCANIRVSIEPIYTKSKCEGAYKNTSLITQGDLLLLKALCTVKVGLNGLDIVFLLRIRGTSSIQLQVLLNTGVSCIDGMATVLQSTIFGFNLLEQMSNLGR